MPLFCQLRCLQKSSNITTILACSYSTSLQLLYQLACSYSASSHTATVLTCRQLLCQLAGGYSANLQATTVSACRQSQCQLTSSYSASSHAATVLARRQLQCQLAGGHNASLHTAIVLACSYSTSLQPLCQLTATMPAYSYYANLQLQQKTEINSRFLTTLQQYRCLFQLLNKSSTYSILSTIYLTV